MVYSAEGSTEYCKLPVATPIATPFATPRASESFLRPCGTSPLVPCHSQPAGRGARHAIVTARRVLYGTARTDGCMADTDMYMDMDMDTNGMRARCMREGLGWGWWRVGEG